MPRTVLPAWTDAKAFVHATFYDADADALYLFGKRPPKAPDARPTYCYCTLAEPDKWHTLPEELPTTDYLPEPLSAAAICTEVLVEDKRITIETK